MNKYIEHNVDNPVYIALVKQYQKEIVNISRLYHYKWKDDSKLPGGGKILETQTNEYRQFRKRWQKLFDGEEKDAKVYLTTITDILDKV